MIIKNIWYKIKQIPLIGIPYEKYIGRKRLKKLYEKKSKIVKEQGISCIIEIEKVLSSLSSLYFIDFGSLLGTIRNNSLIPWDPDIDYGIIINRNFDWKKMEELLNNNGYRKTKQWLLDGDITEQSYIKNELTIDFFAHFRNDDCTSAYLYTRFPGKKYDSSYYDVIEIIAPDIKRIKKERLETIYVSVPLNAEEYLSFVYNDDWMVPNPDWDPYSEGKRRIIPDKKGILFEYK